MDQDTLDFIERLVRAGYLDRDEIRESVADYLADTSAIDEAQVAAAVDAAIDRLRVDASTWPATTDNDRLDRAFERLGAAGVVARQDFACCTSCAHAEIWDEVPDPDAWRGYVWFHRQDTERAVDGDGLYLGFGGRDERSRLQRLILGRSADGARADPAAIGREIVQALADEGLAVTWNGEIDRRILVDPFEWRRRRPS